MYIKCFGLLSNCHLPLSVGSGIFTFAICTKSRVCDVNWKSGSVRTIFGFTLSPDTVKAKGVHKPTRQLKAQRYTLCAGRAGGWPHAERHQTGWRCTFGTSSLARWLITLAALWRKVKRSIPFAWTYLWIFLCVWSVYSELQFAKLHRKKKRDIVLLAAVRIGNVGVLAMFLEDHQHIVLPAGCEGGQNSGLKIS